MAGLERDMAESCIQLLWDAVVQRQTSADRIQGFSESGFSSRIWDISRYIQIYPLGFSCHPQ